MNELNYSEGKFDLKVIGDFSECETEIISSITDDQVSFEIKIKSGSVYVEQCMLLHRGIILGSGYFGKYLNDSESLTVRFESSLIRFI